jgi:DNA-binding LacI/PurR family transcriptional regulator
MNVPNRKKAATLHDVARLAGVSYQTVSRVANGMPHVAPATLERVQKAIAELNYQPNRAARSLITGRSGSMQVIAFEVGNHYPLHAVLAAAQEYGYRASVSTLKDQHSIPELRELLNEIVSHQVDGILLLMPWIDVTYEDLKRFTRGVPFVIVGADLGPGTASVLIDQVGGTELAVNHLLELGHQRVAEISGQVNVYYDACIRHQTLHNTLRAQGLAPVASISGNFSMRSGYRAAEEILESGVAFTALVCANDDMALGATRALLDHGKRIPEDISVVGFDNLPYANYCNPPLTTVKQDFALLGRQGVEHLLTLIKEPQTPPYQRLLYPDLVVRQSTGPLSR